MHNYIIDGKTIKAKITGIDKDGKLLIETESGNLESFAFKEIEYCIWNNKNIIIIYRIANFFLF